MLSVAGHGGGRGGGVPSSVSKQKQRQKQETMDHENDAGDRDLTMDLNCNHFQVKREENR